MIDLIWVGASVAAAAASAWTGAAIGARRARARVTADFEPRVDALQRELRGATSRVDAAERRGRSALERLRGATMAASAEPAPAHYVDRPSPRELDAIASRLRGLAFVEAVVVTDRIGLPLSRAEGPAARDVGALVPAAERVEVAAEGALQGIAEITIVTSDARHVALRRLPAWTGSAWIGALAHSQPPSPLALDAAVASALLAREDLAQAPLGGRAPWSARATVAARPLGGARTVIGAERGDATQKLAAELDRAMVAAGARCIALAHEGRVLCAAAQDGPTESVMGLVLTALEAFRAAASRSLRGPVAHVAIRVGEGDVVGLAPLGRDSRFSLLSISAGRGLDPLEVERLVGRIRRLIPSERAGSTPRDLGSAA